MRPKSAYDNVQIEARFEAVLPHLITLERLDLVDDLISYFGEKNV
eukprot:CAMPEP_0114594114 /NCGR_PEP_ID=MMETSP0125-20121206/15742_1 /TAXON_ID=485358 ORGANISM="Aristerostoma sp., Strain ATCC 50986" /NCGR_SAMPLE_ID=MMETSP0125 /ASSEMBLY_ACC=CAM_ASM_000245 /LENGTH=44 /DNA_ID= /DNA_START= /DNA_END= /DNA_ORIENTATION=